MFSASLRAKLLHCSRTSSFSTASGGKNVVVVGGVRLPFAQTSTIYEDELAVDLQRLAITLALGTPADVYLIDEPSAYLDSEQRINCAKVIKRFIMHSKKTAFVVEHDFIMATYLADRVVVYHGRPGVEATATSPQSLLTGMNQFLQSLAVTFRRDPVNYRPR